MNIIPRAVWPLSIICAAVLISACDSDNTSLKITPLKNEATDGARLPNLTPSPGGAVLNWIEPASAPSATSSTEAPDSELKQKPDAGHLHALRMARYDVNGNTSDALTIATGRDWFINWADFPSVYVLDDNSLVAHWLRRSGSGTYAYDVVTSHSENGIHWTAPTTPHHDGTKTEHGFASFFSVGDNPALVWLDGRNTSPSGGGHADHADNETAGAGNAMTLRTRTLSPTGDVSSSDSVLLDPRVCDCCQTSAVNTDTGAVVFYRNRSESEIRDIAYVRYDTSTGTWNDPAIVFDDGWRINGCPVNGPQADAHNSTVAVAWFTAVPTPRVQVAVSADSGQTFGAPHIVSSAAPLGRVSLVMLDANRMVVSWLEKQDSNFARLNVQLLDSTATVLAEAEVTSLSSTRQSGFARMARLTPESVMITWTEWHGDTSSIRTARIDLL